MKIYRFRVYKNWYAYALMCDAEDARKYFVDKGYPLEAIGEIEESEDDKDFQFKMNSIIPRTTYR